jgi:DNA invertase Pin-like site-specific DNA recombinase
LAHYEIALREALEAVGIGFQIKTVNRRFWSAGVTYPPRTTEMRLNSVPETSWARADCMPRTRSKTVTASGEPESRPCQYVAYYRVSTGKQGRSGLGLEAQRAAVSQFVAKASGELFAEFTEIKSGSTGNRPQLDEALRACRIRRAILVIARLDRLSRNVRLIARLMESGLEFVAVDFPHANRLTIHVLAAVAEYETKVISERVKAGLAAAKARGVKLGGAKEGSRRDLPAANAASVLSRQRRAKARARDLAPIVWGLIAQGKSKGEIAEELTRQGIRTPRKGKWSPSAIEHIQKATADGFASAPDVARAVKIGPRGFQMIERAREIAPLAWELRRRGKSLLSIANELNLRNIPTTKNGPWNGSTVWKILTLTADEPVASGQPFALVRSAMRIARAKNRAKEVAPMVWELRSKGQSHRAIACELNRRNIASPRNKRWLGPAVARIMRYTEQEYASIAEAFRPIRPRTLTALVNARAREVAPAVWELIAKGESPRAIADELNRRHIATVGNRGWHASTVRTVMRRTEREFAVTPEIVDALSLGPNQFQARARAMEIAPIVSELRARGSSLSSIAAELNRRNIPTPEMRKWHSSSVWRIVRRISAAFAPTVPMASDAKL